MHLPVCYTISEFKNRKEIEMKKMLLLLLFMTTFVMLGYNAYAQEVTITLYPGWTWISYPRADAMDVAAALGDFTPVEGDIIKSQTSFTMYQDGEWSGNLTQFIPGVGYMYLSNSTDPVDLVIGAAAPQLTLSIGAPTNINAVSAVCGGNVSLEEGSNVCVMHKGICWGLNPNPTSEDNYLEAENGVGDFSLTMTGLTPSSLYYARVFAITPMGIFYGEQVTFTTLSLSLPTVNTLDPTNITSTSANLKGQVNSDGNGTVTLRGICWNTTGNPTRSADSHQDCGSGTGSFSKGITGLTAGTTYYVRAYAKNEAGTKYGSQKTFTTKAKPTVTTISVYDISSTAAFCGGNVTNNGQGTISARGVCWSTSGTPTINNNKTVNGKTTGSFYSMLGELTPNTTYYVRAYATNEIGTGYGATQTFTTTGPVESNVGIIAHRGVWKYADPSSGTTVNLPGSAQNSIFAVQKAIEYDLEGSEFDVQITGDNQLIIFHDTKMSGKVICTTPLATLQGVAGYTLSNGETVPMLTDFLAACQQALAQQEQRLGERHTKLVLEVKNTGMTDAQRVVLINTIVQNVQQYQLQDDMFFISFDMPSCEMLRELMPNAPVAYLSSKSYNTVDHQLSPQDLLNEHGISHIDYENLLLNDHPTWVEEAHNLGMTVNAWTVDTKTGTNEMLIMDVDYITTNHPLNMRAWFATEP